MKNLHKYHSFLSEKQLDIPNPKDDVWKVLDKTADRISGGEGYGKPIRDLIASHPMFSAVKYGRIVADPDALWDRFEKQRSKNQVLKNVSFAERMVMLLMHWDSLGSGFYHKYNSKKLKFSEWLYAPQKLYRGISKTNYDKHGNRIESDVIESEIESGELKSQPFYSFTFLESVAEKFTIPGYASGGFVMARNKDGWIVETEARPIDFHVFIGTYSDEMEAILRSPVKVKLTRRVLVDKDKKKQTA